MALLNKFNEDLRGYLKSQNEKEVATLRLLLAAIKNKEIEKRAKDGEGELTDEEIIVLVKKEVKKRKEATEIYKQGGRQELAEKETAELKFLERYLPAEASEAEIEIVVKQTIEELKPTSGKDFGKVMKEAIARLKGKGDAAVVSQMIKRYLMNSINIHNE